MRIILLFLWSSVALLAFNFEIINQELANGKSSLIKFKYEPSVEYKSIQVDGKKYQIFPSPREKGSFYALIPFSYYDKPATKTLELYYKENDTLKQKLLFLRLVRGKYAKETIHVDPSKVNPKSPKVKKRIAKEYSEAMRIYKSVTPKSYLREPFILPMQSKITSEFGKARVYNGSLKGYHSGTDFRAKTGTPIIAANDGKVALVKNRFYSGGTVILDHGEGIYTCYFHMSKFDVQEGQVVTKGQKLGLSGQSGRVTGPHLHFSARIAGVQVDPLQLISLLNNNLLKVQN
ncbi:MULTISPECIES: M23 family metallopeptidase [Sulfurimonas]|uniref:M23 family metallopeptidase n=1 Tax=Sulfurimonas TaxID=202746 RepID=UPI0012656AB2|nr:M23 family metallopeptidase [Sulfurimonas indica]